jgi:hypothetical protein
MDKKLCGPCTVDRELSSRMIGSDSFFLFNRVIISSVFLSRCYIPSIGLLALLYYSMEVREQKPLFSFRPNSSPSPCISVMALWTNPPLTGDSAPR